MSNPYLEIGTIIRFHRNKKGYTLNQISAILGYDTPQFLSFIERGISKVPLNTLGQLIVMLDIPEKKILSILINAQKAHILEEISLGKKTAKKSI